MSQPSKVVYVGSIPYDQTEEQLLEVFKSVGNVFNIRLVLDRDTGKSKGFAFVEYHDVETAASAVRNLNNYPVANRKLRVDFSHETTLGPPTNPALASNNNTNTNTNNQSTVISHLPDLPKGKQVPNGQNATDMISSKLSSMNQSRMLQIITDLKSIINNNPAQAQELLDKCPQLAFAAVQSMMTLGIVDTNTVSQLVEGADPATVSPNESQPQSQAPVETPQEQQQQQQQQPQDPVQDPVPEQQYTVQTETTEPTPIGQQTADPEQAALIKQVMELTDEQVAGLPQDQQEQIKELRRRVFSGEIAF